MNRRQAFAWMAGLALAGLGRGVRAELAVGTRAPRLDVALLDGRTLSAASLDGKVVLHVYWATWCPICMQELPVLERLYQSYRLKGFEMLAISVDEDPRDASDFWEAKRYSFPLATRTEPIKQAWGRVLGTPMLYLIDRQGVIRLRQIGAMPTGQLEQRIRALI